MNFDDEYKKRKEEFELYLNDFISCLKNFPPMLAEAMSYCLLSGGKRLRPILLLEAVRVFGGTVDKSAVDFALAIECIHTYSLIHDDLPCMDNDDYRRGKLTCHKKFGETLAVLCGDALLNSAYELILNGANRKDSARYLNAGAEIATASGAGGMVGGQVYDVADSNDSSVIDIIYKKKTAALIRAALTAGAYIGGAQKTDIQNISEFGELFGFCFQLKDDLLDENTEDKNTYLKLYGKQDTEKALNDNTAKAVEILKSIKNSEFLKQLSLHFTKRAE